MFVRYKKAVKSVTQRASPISFPFDCNASEGPLLFNGAFISYRPKQREFPSALRMMFSGRGSTQYTISVAKTAFRSEIGVSDGFEDPKFEWRVQVRSIDDCSVVCILTTTGKESSVMFLNIW